MSKWKKKWEKKFNYNNVLQDDWMKKKEKERHLNVTERLCKVQNKLWKNIHREILCLHWVVQMNSPDFKHSWFQNTILFILFFLKNGKYVIHFITKQS